MLKLSDLSTLNALKAQYQPTTVPASTTGATDAVSTSPVTNYTGVGELQPLVSDLVTQNAAPNSFMRNTYTYNPTDVQKRLSEYSTLDQSTYDKYSPLLTGISPALKTGSNYLFKQDDLNKRLSEYSTLDQSTYDKYSGLSKFSSLSPVIKEETGNRVYNTSDLNKALSSYVAFDPTKLGSDIFSQSIRSNLQKAGDTSYLDSSVSDYYTGLSNSLTNSKIGYYGLNALANPYSKAEYYDNGWRNQPAYGVSLDGRQGMYVPYEAVARIQGDSDADRLTYLKNFLGNEYIMGSGQVVSLPQEVTDAIKARYADQNWVGTDYTFDNPGLGYWFDDPSDFTARVSPGGAVADISSPNGAVNTGHGVHDESGLMGAWIVRNTPEVNFSGVPSIGGLLEDSKWVAQSMNDANLYARLANSDNAWHQSAYDQYVTKKGGLFGGGGILGSIGGVINGTLDALGPAAAFIPYVNMLAAGRAMGQGLQTGNLGQTLSGALGAYSGITGANLAGQIGSAVGAGSGALGQAVGSGLLNTGMGLVGGQNLGDALKSGTIGGLSSYAGGLLGNQLGGGLAGKVGGNLGASALSALLRRGNVNTALQNSLMNSGKGALGALIGKTLNFDKTKG